jgi:hypothetical protein
MKKILFILVLTLIGCRKIAPVVVIPVNLDVFSVSQSSVDNGQELQFNLTKMQFLDFCGCKLILDDSIIEMTRNFVNLKYLNLTWCLNLTDKSIVEGVSKYLNNF